MRPTPANRPGRIRPIVLLLAAGGVLVSCDGNPTRVTRVHRVEIWVQSSTLRPGDQLQAYATPLDEYGKVVETAPVTWRSLQPTTVSVTPYGLITGLAPGVGTIRATAEGVHGTRTITLANPPIATISVNADTLRLSLPGGVSPLIAAPRDLEGLPIIGEPLQWTSSATRIATVSSTGEVRAVAVGTATVTVSAQGVERSVVVIVDAPPTATSPVISSLAPTVAVPGATLIVNGTGFSGSVTANTVLIDGTPVSVTSATATQLTLSLPAATAFPCEPTRVVALQVNSPGGIGTAAVMLQVAAQRDLAVGQAVILTSAADARCNEFAPTAGRYVVTVPNAGRALGAGAIAIGVRGLAQPVAGGGGGEAALRSADRNVAAVRAWRARVPTASPRDRRARMRDAAHHRLLEANRAITGRAPAPAIRAAPATAALEAGAIVPLRFPSIGSESSCANFSTIGARVAYAGSRVTILEDTLPTLGGIPTLAGQQDGLLAQLGAELDAVGWPVLEQFGDPLVMDSRLDADGRVRIVLTPRMNAVLGGAVLAAVVNCDFHPRAVYPASNMGEYVYAQMPTSTEPGGGPGTRERWLHEMRATLVHELKHVTSYAERIVRDHLREETWLEEATARHAEELFARAIFGTLRNGDHDATATLRCEVLALDPMATECAGTPRAMRPHVEGLWDFLAASEARTPIGPTATGDFSFYGSGWALTRWLLDQEGLVERTFFTALTTSSQSGVTNLVARSGRGWDEILPEWSLAMLTDGRMSPPPTSSRLRFPSWDLASLFHGLCEYTGPCAPGGSPSPFDRPHPWRPLQLETGAFAVELPPVEPGGFAAFELIASTPGSRQLLELRGVGGSALPSAVRMGILRVE